MFIKKCPWFLTYWSSPTIVSLLGLHCEDVFICFHYEDVWYSDIIDIIVTETLFSLLSGRARTSKLSFPMVAIGVSLSTKCQWLTMRHHGGGPLFSTVRFIGTRGKPLPVISVQMTNRCSTWVSPLGGSVTVIVDGHSLWERWAELSNLWVISVCFGFLHTHIWLSLLSE